MFTPPLRPGDRYQVTVAKSGGPGMAGIGRNLPWLMMPVCTVDAVVERATDHSMISVLPDASDHSNRIRRASDLGARTVTL